MKIEVEFRSDMSRAERFKPLKIVLEASTRLARRMTPDDLNRLEDFGAALIAAAQNERARRTPRMIEFAARDAGVERVGAARVRA